MSSEDPSGRAAIYVRMSTEHQQYSTENQTKAIEEYAARHNLAIVKRFADYGKSGVKLTGRAALSCLLREVEAGTAEFENILVFDVSRWGRFQDVDESAYYEFVCKKARILVHYCGETFNNDGSLSSALLKALKRSMAAEYSRELSHKVFAGQSHLIRLGYRQGGHAGFGLRRLLVDQERNPKAILKAGERKSIQTDRIILIPGPKEEIATVQGIFDLFTVDLKSPGEIASILNAHGLKTEFGRPWNRNVVYGLLTNPKYIGSNVSSRVSRKVGEQRRTNPASMWIRRDGAFEPIVPFEKFARAQEIVRHRAEQVTDQELLDRLRDLWRRAGKLSSQLIEHDKASPSPSTYRDRFKSLNNAYSLIGYRTSRLYTDQTMGRILNQRRSQLCAEIKASLQTNGASVEDIRPSKLLRVNGRFTMSVYLAPCRRQADRRSFWTVRLDHSIPIDLTVIARLQPGNCEMFDYLFLPYVDPALRRIYLREKPWEIEAYGFEGLDCLPGLVEHYAEWRGSQAR
jgi:DNA invertase Pin-like site-specific DNA recombinase